MFYNKVKIIVDVKFNRKGLRNNIYKLLLRVMILVCLVLNFEIWLNGCVNNVSIVIRR